MESAVVDKTVKRVRENEISKAIEDADFETIESPTIRRLLEELRDGNENAVETHAYNRTHNRHNR